MIIKPLPIAQDPIAGGLPATQRFREWVQSIDKLLRNPPLPSAQAASYVLALIDAGGIVEMNLAGANALTVPNNNTVQFPIGTRITVAQIGTGQTTLTQDAGVTIRSRIGLKLAGQYAVAALYKRDTNEWVASGDLTP